jgi:hypothetical protein
MIRKYSKIAKAEPTQIKKTKLNYNDVSVLLLLLPTELENIVKSYIDYEGMCNELSRHQQLDLRFSDVTFQGYDICIQAIIQNPNELVNIKYQTRDQCLLAVQQKAYTISCIKHITPSLCMDCITVNNNCYSFIPRCMRTKEIMLHAVRSKGMNIKHIRGKRTQTDEIAMAAVLNNGYALQYVNDKTHAIVMAAVSQVGNAISSCQKYPDINQMVIDSWPNLLSLIVADKQTIPMCENAVAKVGHLLKYVRIPHTQKMCEVAVTNDGMALEYTQIQNEVICKLALRNTWKALPFVNDRGVLLYIYNGERKRQ